MGLAAILPHLAGLRVTRVELCPDELVLELATRATRARCPECGRCSRRIHGYYTRKVADLPWHGVAVKLELRTRRLRCRNSLCTKRVFCERLPRVVSYYGRKTVRLEGALRLIGYLLGGEAGARATRKLAMRTSPDTMLRRMRASVKPCRRRGRQP